MWPGPRPTSIPSGILIHPTVWPQYTNVTDRQGRQTTVRSCHYHISALRHTRPLLTLDTDKAMAVAIVGSRLDYCNSVLYGMSQANTNRLQRVQNILARVVAQAPWTVSSDIRRDLHWLPVSHRIKF